MDSSRRRCWRWSLLLLLFAVAGSTLAVSILKYLVPMECPWDLTRYGGDLPFVGLLERRPADMPDTACFPAGHASAGYAWLALYFFLAAIVRCAVSALSDELIAQEGEMF